MSRPKFFRDPVHVQLRFEAADLSKPAPPAGLAQQSWILRNLIETREFQRLRFIRQNGLGNLVFHGAEHSRFTHSLGASHLAGEMYDRIIRNMNEANDAGIRLHVVSAALLHDIGHGPFSHLLEEVAEAVGVDFDHEVMTVRLMEEDESGVSNVLKSVDTKLPGALAAFIDKSRRAKDSWTYKLVSSQLDADRLDYVHRDSMFAGVRGHGFDLARLLDLLYHHGADKIAVERGAIEAVEAYLVTLDQLYRAIYYHHAVRAANRVLSSCLRRAAVLAKSDKKVFPPLYGSAHPLSELLEKGQTIELHHYVRLTENQIWSLIDLWTDHEDKILSDLSQRLLCRNLFKTVRLTEKFSATEALKERARKIARELFKLKEEDVDYYVAIDEPERTSYKRYDWKPDANAESIWMIGEGQEPRPIEDEKDSKIVEAIKVTRYFPRLICPREVRDKLLIV